MIFHSQFVTRTTAFKANTQEWLILWMASDRKKKKKEKKEKQLQTPTFLKVIFLSLLFVLRVHRERGD